MQATDTKMRATNEYTEEVLPSSLSPSSETLPFFFSFPNETYKLMEINEGWVVTTLEQNKTEFHEIEKKETFIDRLRKLQREHNLSDEFIEDFFEIEGAEDLIDEEILVLNKVIGKFDLDPKFSLEEICFGETQDLYD